MHKAKEPFVEIIEAISDMSPLLKQLSLVYLFQWYALFIYWQFITPMLSKSLFGLTKEDLAKMDEIKEAYVNGVLSAMLILHLQQRFRDSRNKLWRKRA